MNDLDAPLGMDKRPSPAKAKAAKTVKPFSKLAIIALGSVAVLNLFTLFSAQQTTQTAIVQLPEPEPVEIAQNKPETAEQDAEPEVKIIYGDPDIALNDNNNAAPALPTPEPRQEITEISPGGPRVITVIDPTAARIGQPENQAHLPVQEALEDSPHGQLPIRTSNGRRPADIYARPWSRGGGKRIAIVIGGLGLSQTGTQRAIEDLPPEITLAFAPTGNSLTRWMRAARRKGHELLIQVPMEPFNYPQVNPGPNTLRLASSTETNIDNLHWALGRITNYTGITNYLGARFMADERGMNPVMEELGRRGLLFFNDGSGAANAAVNANAQRTGVPYLAGNVIIDSSNDGTAIRNKLKALETIATVRGKAVGSGSALELTIKEVAAWANDAKKRGFEIVGVAALSNDPERGR